MRIILHASRLGINAKELPELPDDTYVLTCIENFSVGPLSAWQDRAKFNESRSEFWHKTELLTLPDGSEIDYFVWYQSLPHHDLAKMVHSGLNIEKLPMPYTLHELIPAAKSIEIWYDVTVSGLVFLWYSLAVLQDFQVDPICISTCEWADPLKERPRAFWKSMLLDKSDRAIPAIRISKTRWTQALQYWDTITKLPEPVDPTLMRRAEGPVRKAIAILSERHPSKATGLTNIQERLLGSTRHEWQKMAVIIGHAIIAGSKASDPVGDLVLKTELYEMAQVTPPLVEIDGEGAMHLCRVRLTPHGKAKLCSLSS